MRGLPVDWRAWNKSVLKRVLGMIAKGYKIESQGSTGIAMGKKGSNTIVINK